MGMQTWGVSAFSILFSRKVIMVMNSCVTCTCRMQGSPEFCGENMPGKKASFFREKMNKGTS